MRRIPLVARVAQVATGECETPGHYDERVSMRVATRGDVAVPLVDMPGPELSVLTKTARRAERDDDNFQQLLTKTDSRRESDDEDRLAAVLATITKTSGAAREAEDRDPT